MLWHWDKLATNLPTWWCTTREGCTQEHKETDSKLHLNVSNDKQHEQVITNEHECYDKTERHARMTSHMAVIVFITIQASPCCDQFEIMDSLTRTLSLSLSNWLERAINKLYNQGQREKQEANRARSIKLRACPIVWIGNINLMDGKL